MTRDEKVEAPPQDRLQTLDLLRFAAALCVMLFHLGFWSWAETRISASELGGAASYPELFYLSAWGWIGVHIFFVISGYVISLSAQNSTPVRFLRSRFLRLFPAALICATVTLFVCIGIGWQPLPDLFLMYAKTILFWPLSGWIDGVYWTLGIEISFYGVVFLLLIAGRPRWIEPTVISIGFISAALIVNRSLSEAGFNRIEDLLLMQYGVYFAIGSIIFSSHKNGWNTARIAALCVFIPAAALPILLTARRDFSGSELLIPVAVWLAAVAVILRAPALEKYLPKTAWISLLGLATYPLYLIHNLVGSALMKALIEIGVERFTALLLACVSMVGLAIAITIWAERPIVDRIRLLWPLSRRQFASTAA